MTKRSAGLETGVPVELASSLTPCVPSALPIRKYTAVERNAEFQNQGQTIRGTLTVPDANGPFPIVIMFHGFHAQRNEMPVVGTDETLFGRTARVLAEQGFASLRIDFRGTGVSDGLWIETTSEGQISDAQASVEYARQLDEVDSNRLALLGYSQGGLVAASVAGRNRHIASVVLWAPLANPPASLGNLLGADALKKGLDSGVDDIVNGVLPWGTLVPLKGSFFRELYMLDPVAEITAYDGPLLVVVGLNDTLVSPQPQSGAIYLAYHRGNGALVEIDADHKFDSPIGHEKVDELICATAGWLETTL